MRWPMALRRHRACVSRQCQPRMERFSTARLVFTCLRLATRVARSRKMTQMHVCDEIDCNMPSITLASLIRQFETTDLAMRLSIAINQEDDDPCAMRRVHKGNVESNPTGRLGFHHPCSESTRSARLRGVRTAGYDFAMR